MFKPNYIVDYVRGLKRNKSASLNESDKFKKICWDLNKSIIQLEDFFELETADMTNKMLQDRNNLNKEDLKLLIGFMGKTLSKVRVYSKDWQKQLDTKRKK